MQNKAPSNMVTCPKCGGARGYTKDMRPVEGRIRRRKQCAACSHRFTTWEASEEKPLELTKTELHSMVNIVDTLAETLDTIRARLTESLTK